MSVMLATTNADAARRATPGPMPSPGDTVIYYMRPGEIRAGQKSVPGYVLASDEDNRQLKILVFYDHQDMMTLERVPERTGSDQGWVARESGGADVVALRAEIAALSASFESLKIEFADVLFGEHDKPVESYEDRMRAMAKQIAALAKKAK